MHAYNLHTGKVDTGESLVVAGQLAHLASELQVQCKSVSKKQGDWYPRDDSQGMSSGL